MVVSLVNWLSNVFDVLHALVVAGTSYAILFLLAYRCIRGKKTAPERRDPLADYERARSRYEFDRITTGWLVDMLRDARDRRLRLTVVRRITQDAVGGEKAQTDSFLITGVDDDGTVSMEPYPNVQGPSLDQDTWFDNMKPPVGQWCLIDLDAVKWGPHNHHDNVLYVYAMQTIPDEMWTAARRARHAVKPTPADFGLTDDEVVEPQVIVTGR